jgi:alpha-beta hydrolase superfamily lysophospholipase/predicted GNAT family N-acyltransferase
MKKADSRDDPVKLKFGAWSDLQSDATWVRSRVFVDEQGIDPEHEWDDADAVALHCVAYRQKQPIATARLLPDAHIGRMAVLPEHRREGVARQVLAALMQIGFRRGDSVFELSAQTAVKDLYSAFGFSVTSDPYLEVGIEHVEMRFASELTETRQPVAEGVSLYQVDWRSAVPLPKWHKGSQAADCTTPTTVARGIYLLHGLGEHCRRYDALARWLNSLGWQVRAHDHRGHGASDGKRGVISHRRELLDDAKAQISRFAAELGGPPVLLGHSMGGSLAAELVLVDGLVVRALILSSPALALRLSVGQRWLLKLMNRLAPGVAVANGIDPTHISHDPDVVAAYRNDPLVHNKVCARLVTSLLYGGELIQERTSALEVPALLMVAGSDRLVDPAGSVQLSERAGKRGLDTRWYESAHHEIFNEAEPLRQQVVNDFRDWLEHHFPASARSARGVGPPQSSDSVRLD